MLVVKLPCASGAYSKQKLVRVARTHSTEAPGRTFQHRQLRRLDHRSGRGAAASPEGVQGAVRARCHAELRLARVHREAAGGAEEADAREHDRTHCAHLVILFPSVQRGAQVAAGGEGEPWSPNTDKIR